MVATTGTLTLTVYPAAARHALLISSGRRRKVSQSCGWRGLKKKKVTSPGGLDPPPTSALARRSLLPQGEYPAMHREAGQVPQPRHRGAKRGSDLPALRKRHLVWKPSPEPAQVPHPTPALGRAPEAADASPAEPRPLCPQDSCSSSCRNSRLWSPARSPDLQDGRHLVGPASW